MATFTLYALVGSRFDSKRTVKFLTQLFVNGSSKLVETLYTLFLDFIKISSYV